jgi:cell pole-organizing protein PopZ
MRDVMRRRQFDEIILSTLPPGVSRWLGQDLPHRAEKQFRLPIQHVVAVEEVAPV